MEKNDIGAREREFTRDTGWGTICWYSNLIVVLDLCELHPGLVLSVWVNSGDVGRAVDFWWQR